MAVISRTDVDSLIEVQVANEIFEGVIKDSKALSMFRRLPNMTSDKTKLRVLDSLPVAYFVDETTNNGRKNTTKMAWDKKYINAAELAVIVPIKENVLNDSSIDIWAEVRPRIVEAFAKKIDNAMFFGVDKPSDWRAGLVPSVISAGAEVNETQNGLYSDINDAMVKVEESGYNVNGILGGVGLKGKFRMMLDTTGQPLNTTEIGSVRREFMDNGVWDKTKSTLLVGDFSQAVYSIRQDVTYKVLDQAIIQDTDGSILYNLAQDDMVALRVVMRLGWEIPNPVNALNETDARFPFASLKPATVPSL
jgi:HK97 family phage major capsid protein